MFNNSIKTNDKHAPIAPKFLIKIIEKSILNINDNTCGNKISLWLLTKIKNEFRIPAIHCNKNANEKYFKNSIAKNNSFSIKKEI